MAIGERKVLSDEDNLHAKIQELKDEITSLRSILLTFPDHVTQVVKMRVSKILSELSDRGEKVEASK